MKIIDLLNQLKSEGHTNLVGLSGTTNIDDYIANVMALHDTSVEYAAQGIACHQYYLDHEDDYYMITTKEGHKIIVDSGCYNMPIYSTCENEDQMYAEAESYEIAEKAEKIASEMLAERPGIMSKAEWYIVAYAELRATYAQLESEINQALTCC